jgi:spore maturation protein CgeB
MRILAVHPGPAFSVADVYDGYVDALRGLGIEVHGYNLDARLQLYTGALLEQEQRGSNGELILRKALSYEQAVDLALNGLMASVYRLWPDVLLVVSALFVDDKMLDCIRSRGTRVVILHTEEPYEHDRQVELAGHADLNLINDPTHLESFRAVAPTWYAPHAYRPDRHHPRPPDPALACDFAFVGTGYPSRISFLEQVDWSGLDVRLAGNWMGLDDGSPLRRYMVGDVSYCLPNDEAVGLYASCGMSANLYRREADRPDLVQGWAMSPREVELAAMGVPFLREARGEGDEVLPMLPTFAGPEDFGEALRWWVGHPDDRAEAAVKARVAVADRTFEAHAGMLLRLLGHRS